MVFYNEDVVENLFEKRAETILRYLKVDQRYGESHFPRPFFVEFTGSPDSGKTTTINSLYHSFKDLGFRTYKPLEGAEQIYRVSRSTPLYNIRTAMYAITQLIDLAHSHELDLVLFDRCAFDGYYWMMYWLAKGKLTEEETKHWQETFLSGFWVNNLDAAYLVVCDPDEALKRNRMDTLSTTFGNTTNPQNMRILVDRLRQMYQNLSFRFPQLKIINTAKMEKREMFQFFADDILSTMENKIVSCKLKAV